MAVANSAERNEQILKIKKQNRDLCPDDRIWAGYIDILEEGTFLDGNTEVGQEVLVPTWSNWTVNEPNGGELENCIVLLDSGLWNDIRCGGYMSKLGCTMCDLDKVPQLYLRGRDAKRDLNVL